MGLLVNEQKTKYMLFGHSHFKEQYFVARDYKFECAERFSHLGSPVGHDDVSQEIKQRIVVANKCYHGLARQLKYSFLSQHNKIKTHKMLIRPVLLYGLEKRPLKIQDTESPGSI
jgi:hypothetical protein